MARKKLGQMQQYLLSEIVNSEDWVDIGPEVCGSNYGGQKKHESMVDSLHKRGLVEIRKRGDYIQARSLPKAQDLI